jgi:hypothetical protein
MSRDREETVTFNIAGWECPHDLPADGWLVVNAPRPLLGELTWQGPFRHGIFYAAHRDPATLTGEFDRHHAEQIVASWRSDDAWPVRFTTNAEIEQQVGAALADHKTTLDELGTTMGELAYQMDLPWHDAESAP